MKKLVALFLAATLVVSVAGCGNNNSTEGTDSTGAGTETTQSVPLDVVSFEGDYTYDDSVSVLTANWNPHTYQTSDDDYLTGYLRTGLYDFLYNDELHPVEGKEAYEGYVIIPSMAADFPVDVTEQVKTEHPEFGIPESATSGFAYTIDLNPNAVWEDGTPINADTYVYSMQQLLDPNMLNYRAADYYTGSLVIAGAEGYANSGRTVKNDNSADGETFVYPYAELTAGEDGNYVTSNGEKAFFGLNVGYAWMGGDSLSAYHDAGYISEDIWTVLSGAADEDGYAPVNAETIAALFEFTNSDVWGNETEDQLAYYVSYEVSYPEVDYSTVGCYKTGDYQITLVFGKALSGFNLYYNISTAWLVYEDLYESCKKQDGDAWSTTYNTSVETTVSYGPYKLVEYQQEKALRLERNENWFGYNDTKYLYVDPTDGLTYPMYQTTAITCQQVPESETNKMMFLKGELMRYGLGAEDFATYRNSEYAYSTPAETVFFLIFNGYLDALNNRESSDGFDTTKNDLQIMSLKSFRQAVALAYDKELFASTISPARSGAYGLIGTPYVYDPETGARYRDSDAAKQVLCDFYSVDVSKYSSLDEAVSSITGYDPVEAKNYFAQAFTEALDRNFITDTDGDGICDQTISIEYAMSVDSDFMTQTVDYLNEKIAEVVAGTAFEGKIQFVKSAPYGNDWSNKIRDGLSDTVLAGWSGSLLDPFGLTDLYVNPSKQYDANWFNATTTSLTQEIAGTSVTMNLKQWSDALNGITVTVDGTEYNFGEGQLDIEARLAILAGIEGAVLQTYDYIPMLQNASMQLLSQKVYYVVDEYSPIMIRGGIAYLKYNYSDAEWTDYVASQGGELQY